MKILQNNSKMLPHCGWSLVNSGGKEILMMTSLVTIFICSSRDCFETNKLKWEAVGCVGFYVQTELVMSESSSPSV